MTKPTEEQIRHAYGQFIYMNGYTETPQNAKDLFLTPENVFRDGYERGHIAALSIDPWHYSPTPTKEGLYFVAMRNVEGGGIRYEKAFCDGKWWDCPAIKGDTSLYKTIARMPVSPVKETS